MQAKIGKWFHVIGLCVVLSGLLRLPVHAQAADALNVPKIIGRATNQSFDFFPVRARRLGLEGRVLVAFTVAPTGRVADLRVSASDQNGMFDDSALTYVRGMEFAVPKGWGEGSSPSRELTINFVYRIQRCAGLEPADLPPFPSDYPTVTVTAEAMGCGSH